MDIRAIKDHTFSWCSGLTTAIPNDGQEVIGARAFQGFIFLLRIKKPPTVRAIDKTALKRCSNSTNVRFLQQHRMQKSLQMTFGFVIVVRVLTIVFRIEACLMLERLIEASELEMVIF